MDGLTPYALKGFNKHFHKIYLHENKISKLMNESISFQNSYGYGETYSTTYAINTGENIYKNNCDSFQNFNSFKNNNKNLASYFKKNKYVNIFFRNAHQDSPIKGFYKRYLDAITKSYHYKLLKKKKKNYSLKNFFSEHNLHEVIKNNKNIFFYIHDFTLHDHKLVYRNSTPQKYLKALKQACLVFENNLKILNFNYKTDILYFLSDHGMTFAPIDEIYFKKNSNLYNNFYQNIFADDKIKSVFFIHSHIKKKIIFNKFVKPENTYKIIKTFAKNYYKKELLFLLKKFLKKNILISLRSPLSDTKNNFFLKETLHTHSIFINKNSKISYSHNHDKKFINLNSFKIISNSKVPKLLSQHVKIYYSKKNIMRKITIYFISIILRSIDKIYYTLSSKKNFRC